MNGQYDYDKIYESRDAWEDAERARIQKESRRNYFFLGVFLLGMASALAVGLLVKPLYAVSCIGVSLLAVSIYALSATKDRAALLPLAILLLLSLAAAVLPFVWEYQQAHPEQPPILTPRTAALAGQGVFLLVGLCLLFLAISTHLHRKRCCTVPLQAVCVQVITRRNRNHHIIRTPVWQYVYQGNTYTQRDSLSSNFYLPSVGLQTEVMVNPAHPEDFYRKGSGEIPLLYAVGVIMTAIPLLLMYLTITGKM